VYLHEASVLQVSNFRKTFDHYFLLTVNIFTTSHIYSTAPHCWSQYTQ